MDGDESPQHEPEDQAELEEDDDQYELAYVIFTTPNIDFPEAEALLDAMGQCATANIEEVHLLISTFGGNVTAGVNAYNILRGMPFRLVTHNTSDVMSIGVAVYLAGDERLVCPDAKFLTHGVTHRTTGQAFGAQWFGDTRKLILADEAKINAILADRTSLSLDELDAAAGTEHTHDADAAIANGIAHRKEDVDIPADALVLTVTTRNTVVAS